MYITQLNTHIIIKKATHVVLCGQTASSFDMWVENKGSGIPLPLRITIFKPLKCLDDIV